MAADLVKDEKDAFMLYAIIPGLNAEDVEIEILNDVVSISGEFTHEVEEDDVYLRNERPSGHFHRSLRFATELEADRSDSVRLS